MLFPVLVTVTLFWSEVSEHVRCFPLLVPFHIPQLLKVFSRSQCLLSLLKR